MMINSENSTYNIDKFDKENIMVENKVYKRQLIYKRGIPYYIYYITKIQYKTKKTMVKQEN